MIGKAALGFLIVILAGGLNSSFALPLKKTSRWAWENTWLVYSIVGLIVVNWAIAWWTVPALGTVYTQAGWWATSMVVIFGIIWGSSNVMLGLGFDLVGVSLSFPITIGLSAAIGSLVPMLRRPAVFLTAGGMYTTLGVAVMLVGVWLCALAGVRRDLQIARNSAEHQSTAAADTHRRLIRGLILVVLSGLLDPFQNLALDLGEPVRKAAIATGTAEVDQFNAIWGLNLTGGCLVNVGYCIYLLRRNSTWSRFRQPGTGSHWGLAALMGFIWMISVYLYGQGAGLMGDVLGISIGWATFYGLIIMSSNVWGWLTAEWRGGEGRPMRTMLAALGVLLIAVAILGYANYRSNETPTAATSQSSQTNAPA
jgi:L-rhamnose-H+ transport protein